MSFRARMTTDVSSLTVTFDSRERLQKFQLHIIDRVSECKILPCVYSIEIKYYANRSTFDALVCKACEHIFIRAYPHLHRTRAFSAWMRACIYAPARRSRVRNEDVNAFIFSRIFLLCVVSSRTIYKCSNNKLRTLL